MLPAGCTWKVEYLYVDLGSLDIVSPFPAAKPTQFVFPFTGPLTTHTRFTDNIVRVGLNYRFGANLQLGQLRAGNYHRPMSDSAGGKLA